MLRKNPVLPRRRDAPFAGLSLSRGVAMSGAVVLVGVGGGEGVKEVDVKDVAGAPRGPRNARHTPPPDPSDARRRAWNNPRPHINTQRDGNISDWMMATN